MKLPVVAIVGRPNVGKSTLFNRIVGKRIAVVHDEPGVTRDRNYASAEWERRKFLLVDTGGIVLETKSSLLRQMRAQAEAAIEEADLVLFVVDVQTGLTTEDQEITRRLFRSGGQTMLVVNKVDHARDEWGAGEHMRLGLGEAFPVSAAHGRGKGDLLSEIVSHLPRPEKGEVEDDSIRVAVVGRPNVGKSSLVNALLQQDRMVVDEVAGTTRDAIDSEVVAHGQKYILVDTAGLRRKARVKESVEFFSSVRTRNSLERAQVAILMLDATTPISAQDQHVAAELADMGRAAIMVFNKWDLVAKQTNTARDVEAEARLVMPYMDFAPAVFLSALTRQRVSRLFPMLKEAFDKGSRKISTGELNRFFEKVQRYLPVPSSKSGLKPHIYYATQTGVLPPSFNVYVNHPKALAPNYVRYLKNQMREHWDLVGTPVHLRFRRSE